MDADGEIVLAEKGSPDFCPKARRPRENNLHTWDKWLGAGRFECTRCGAMSPEPKVVEDDLAEVKQLEATTASAPAADDGHEA